ncbi:MAG: EF-hand domain-containing protein [Planctomycetes bacterium]|nr:EF-hand domain-containing protein [Planctomycetota bacterium]MCW8134067.1 EF-hand domain-containing protein [Planctomycetota bacterium]
MKFTYLFALCAALLAGPVAAQEEPAEPEGVSREVKFKNTDLDGDGKVTFEEMKKVHHDSNKRMREAKESLDEKKIAEADKWISERLFLFEFLFRDEDKNRVLTKDEYIKNIPEGLEITEKDHIDQEDVEFDDMLRFDGNKDGKLSIDELQKAALAELQRYKKIAGDDADKLEKLLDVQNFYMVGYTLLCRDANNDGTLTREENKSYAEKMVKGEAGYLLSKENIKRFGSYMAETYFSLYDKDGDKALTMEELKAAKNPPTEEEFKKIDKNGDGKVTGDELAQAMTEDMPAPDDDSDGKPPTPDKEGK